MVPLQKINFKQPKYMLPLIIYIPLLVTAYFIIDIFDTELADIPDKHMQTTEYLNHNLPGVQMKGDGIGGKYESMVKAYGKIDDYSAIDNIDRNEQVTNESYESKYSDEDISLLDSIETSNNLEEQLRESAERGFEMGLDEEERLARSQAQQQQVIEELNRALAEARLNGQAIISPTPSNEDTTATATEIKGTIEINERMVKAPSEEEESYDVVKKVKLSSDYFHTLAENEPEPNLIKAIIDEDIKAIDGSRVRLRLLDDIEINDLVVSKGSYIYAIMSGFGSQRVKGTIKSIMINDHILKVSLSLYDTDGLEGLYVPSSSFRETTKDVASGAMSGSMNMNTTSSGNSLSQWGMQAIQNAYQKTSNAISKAIKKNTAKLKYGTFVYLVNGQENKNK